MKPILKIQTLTMICAYGFVLANAPGANAFSFGKNKAPKVDQDPALTLNIQETPDQAAQQQQVLRDLAQSMTQRIQSIEAKIAANQTQEALSLAKQVLDEVRLKPASIPKQSFCQYMTHPLLTNRSTRSFFSNGPRPRVTGSWGDYLADEKQMTTKSGDRDRKIFKSFKLDLEQERLKQIKLETGQIQQRH